MKAYLNRSTRDKFAKGTDQSDLTTGNACWETAPPVFRKLNKDFGPFDIDITADRQRHLCPIWFGPDSPVKEYDALTTTWLQYGRNGFSNPPYGAFVQKILRAAKLEAAQGFTSTFLLPMRVTKAFHAHVLQGAADLMFCDARLTFYENGEPRWNAKKLAQGLYVPDPAMFDSIVVRYLPGVSKFNMPRLGVWNVPEHTAAAIAKKLWDAA